MTVVQIVFCIFLLSISVCYLFTSGEQFQQGMDELKQQYYELNFDKLRDMWYSGMMRGVLKAKAKNLCESLPQNECILYSLCASDAQSLVELAKCVVTLLDERDRQIAINEEYRRQLQAGVTPVESEIFSRFPSFEHMNKELRIMLAKLETSLKSSIQQQHSMQSSSNENENRSIIMKSLPIQPQSDEVMITHYQSSTSSSHVDKKIPANFQTVKESLLQIYPSSSTQLLTTFTRDQNDTGDQRISVEEKTIHMNVPVKIESNRGDISDTNIRSNYSKSLTSSKFMGNNREKGQQIIRSQKRRDHKNSYNKGSGKHRNRTAEGNASEQRVNLGGLNGDAFEHENLHKLQEGIAKRDEPKADITTEPLHTKMRSIKITWPKMRNESDSTHRNLRKRSGVQRGTSAINRKERRRRSSQASANKGTGTSRPSSKEPSNVKKLRIIRDHFSRLGQINEYIKRMNQENSRFLHEINMPMESRFETIEDANQNEMLNDIVAMINAFQKTGKDGPSISIMSPRLFSIVPEASRRPQLLSPTLLSFQKDGFFSVPDLLDMATNRKSDATHLVDLIVELSGAATVLNKLYEKLQPQIKEVNEIHLPAIREFERQEQNWQNVIDSYSEKQKLDLKKRGYAHLEPEQLQLIYDKPIGVLRGIDVNWTQYANMNETQREQRLEANIRQLAMFDEKLSKPIGRVKRQTQYGSAKTVGLEEESGPTYRTLSPYAFTNRIGQGLALEAVTLSPHAFIPEILFPEGVVLYTLSPRAFIGSILSPQALIGRIISPSAFRGDVLSPRALVAHVLSPEALFAEVLTPRFIEPRIISPELLIIYVLSPEFLAPHVLSDESIGVFVLSPHVLSPRLWSQDHMIVEILSPDILGGGYPESEEKK